jgi:positive regulator of sigma E activity
VYNEAFYEEGTVLQADGGEAQVLLSGGEGCQDCLARTVCRAGAQDERHLAARDSLGVRVGDKVRVEVYGSSLLKASALVYGAPLALLAAGLALGLSVSGELAGGLLALGLPGAYMLGLLAYSRLRPVRPVRRPRIVAVMEGE